MSNYKGKSIGSNFYHGRNLGSHNLSNMSGSPRTGADSGFSQYLGSRKSYANEDQDMQEKDNIEDVLDDDTLYEQHLRELALSDIYSGIKKGVNYGIDRVKRHVGIPGLKKIGPDGRALIQAFGYGIPGIGDVAALYAFVKNANDMREATQEMTRLLSKLTGVELGNDFLEPEGSVYSNEKKFYNLDVMQDYSLGASASLDRKLETVKNALLDLNNPMYSDLEVTYDDIQRLQKLYNKSLAELRNCFIAFFGAVDIFFFQAGIIASVAIAITKPEQMLNDIVVKHATAMTKLKDMGWPLQILLTALDYVSEPLDYLGNLDLLVNVNKLNRFLVINEILQHFKGIQTLEDKIKLGLTITKKDEGFDKLSSATGGQLGDKIKIAGYEFEIPDELKFAKDIPAVSSFSELGNLLTKIPGSFKNIFRENKSAIQSTLDYLDEKSTCEDDAKESTCEDDVKEISGAMAIQVGTLPLGMSTSGPQGQHSSRTGGRAYPYAKSTRKKFNKAAQKTFGGINESTVINQEWNHKTLGKIKF